jgi:hypothetical protein
MTMDRRRRLAGYEFGLALLTACFCLLGDARSQSSGQATTPPPTTVSTSSDSTEGKQIGDFLVTQSVEVGGRISDVTGSQAMYNTLENYRPAHASSNSR